MKIAKKALKLADAFKVRHADSFRLKDYDPADIRGIHSKEKADELLQQSMAVLQGLQEKLYAQDQWAVLLIFQAMDAAGKDSLIKHVMSGVNPQACEVSSFKQPSTEELNHDFLWRTTRRLPERGKIGIFNRSYYEEVLIVRVHQEYLQKQHLPPELVTKKIWKERFKDIRNFEEYLTRNGVVIRKFFLHISKEEQKKRFLARLQEPEKNWKFSEADVHERKYWDDYMNAYEEMIRHTSTPDAPWYVVPADHKWFTHIAVSSAIIQTLEEMDLQFPKIDKTHSRQLEEAQQMLLKSSD
ncbi:MAG TPA: polyphosphate kinase 2 family protein [Blattabacteriaceae bacterium]|nr:polyphosphate kinase 2 family protein [Blattabacteriaceae bacterium]